MGLNDVLSALLEGAVSQKYGPDFRAKQQLALLGPAKAVADIQHTQAETGESQARVPLIGAQTAQANTATAHLQAQLDEIGQQREAALVAFRAKQIDSPNLAVAQQILAKKESEVKAQLEAAQAGLAGAQTANAKGQFGEEEKLAHIRGGYQVAAAGAMPMEVADPNKPGGSIFVSRGQVVRGGFQPKPDKMSAQERGRQDQADIIQQQGDNLINHITALRSKLGPAVGALAGVRDRLGLLPPDVRALRTELQSYAAGLGLLHGARNGSALVDEFNRMVGDINQPPENLIRGIRSVQQLASTVKANTGPGGPDAHAVTGAPAGGSTHWTFDAHGNLVQQ